MHHFPPCLAAYADFRTTGNDLQENYEELLRGSLCSLETCRQSRLIFKLTRGAGAFQTFGRLRNVPIHFGEINSF